jgi:hypothetical protein
MGAGEIIAIVAITLIIGGAVFYIVKAKKSGRKCIGCPDGCSCKSDKNCKDCNTCPKK